ncbi:hypothetical protein JCM10049v2_000037 [Rhodotorula toruloides]
MMPPAQMRYADAGGYPAHPHPDRAQQYPAHDTRGALATSAARPLLPPNGYQAFASRQAPQPYPGGGQYYDARAGPGGGGGPYAAAHMSAAGGVAVVVPGAPSLPPTINGGGPSSFVNQHMQPRQAHPHTRPPHPQAMHAAPPLRVQTDRRVVDAGHQHPRQSSPTKLSKRGPPHGHPHPPVPAGPLFHPAALSQRPPPRDPSDPDLLRPSTTWKPRTTSRIGAPGSLPPPSAAMAGSAHASPLPSPSLSNGSHSTTASFPGHPNGSNTSLNSPRSQSQSRSPKHRQHGGAPPPPPLAPPFNPSDWSTHPSQSQVVSPSLYLLWQSSPLPGRAKFESVFVDAELRRVNYVAREYHRGRDGVLRREGEKGSQKAEDEAGAAAGWADFFDGFDAHNGGGGGLEWLLLEVPSASARERGSDQLAKVGLVTEETLFLPLGKNIKWRKFYKEPVFGSGEPTWKGVGGGKYKWQKEKDSEECYTLVDDKTKETVVSVLERPGKPTQIILSALIQPSLHPILLTLLHRTFLTDQKRRSKDQERWEEEEVVTW